MARPLGSAKTPGSGRKKGTPNKRSQDLQEKAQKLGVDPFEILLYFAKGDWKALGYESEKITIYGKDVVNEEFVIDPGIRASSAAQACQYLYPKLKQIEGKLQVDPTAERPLKHLTDEELEKL